MPEHPHRADLTPIGICHPLERRASMRHRSSEISGSRIRIAYAIELTYEVLAPADFIFAIHAARTPQQSVSAESFDTTPVIAVHVDEDPSFGNRLARLHAEPGPLVVRYAA